MTPRTTPIWIGSSWKRGVTGGLPGPCCVLRVCITIRDPLIFLFLLSNHHPLALSLVESSPASLPVPLNAPPLCSLPTTFHLIPSPPPLPTPMALEFAEIPPSSPLRVCVVYPTPHRLSSVNTNSHTGPCSPTPIPTFHSFPSPASYFTQMTQIARS